MLAFNPYDKIVTNEEDEEQDNDAMHKKPQKEFLVQMFGINEKGETACIFVVGQRPRT